MSWNFDMKAAPKDGTLLQLLIDHSEAEPDGCAGGFEDGPRTRTMGFNNFDNDEQDVWKFPGWDWCHDCITEQGCGIPIAWDFMLPLPEKETKDGHM